ncbi:MAG: DUF1730 domain-containing protein, partial [Acidobacteriota bacterium]|nr:DUF1730 domain-containing protein [Acidobacteriota bacterium]
MSTVSQQLSSSLVRELALECGFHLAGVTVSGPSPDFGRYRSWVNRGLAGEMGYLTDRRADVRSDAANLLPGARSVISVGLIYNTSDLHSTELSDPERVWIGRYAWGEDYHNVLRARLRLLADKLLKYQQFSWREFVDTAPLLERSIARQAGLGWIGRNTCLINQQLG